MLFRSYIIANRIFSLAEYYAEATNEDIENFSKHSGVSILDEEWLFEHSNSVMRKQITLIQKSKILDGADTGKIQKKAKGFKLKIELDIKGKIVFPSDTKYCKEILVFLNEQYFTGVITGNHYKTNSKRSI